eukprot:scaffold19186_cov51-Phaeocystis_antarctica.AAC.1
MSTNYYPPVFTGYANALPLSTVSTTALSDRKLDALHLDGPADTECNQEKEVKGAPARSEPSHPRPRTAAATP